ncbi:MAG TPA: hypothetical protein VFE34_00960, partial [Dongiaceae bacterium]|nr:hypothetical protein [Dongiaceae bacterium]
MIVGRRDLDRVTAGRERAGHGDGSGRSVDRKQAVAIIGQAVGNAVAGIRVDRQPGDPHCRSDRGILRDRAGRRIIVCHEAQLIQVGDANRECLGRGQTAAARSLHGDRMRRRAFEIQQRPVGHRNDACNRIDREPAAGIIRQAVGD